MKRICITGLFLMASFIAHAGTMTKQGVLQAYWLPVVMDGHTNHPELELRFFTFKPNGGVDKVIDLETEKLNPDLINKTFRNIPGEFITYQEGHIEQYGTITLSDYRVSKDCDSKTYSAKLVGFDPDTENKKMDVVSSECGGSLWELFYQLNKDTKYATLRSEPSENAVNVGTISSDSVLVKIKTENHKWFYVAIFDSSKNDSIGDVKGYIQSNNVFIAN